MKTQKNKLEDIEIETSLGFIDITKGLEKGIIDEFYKYDVIRNILIDRIKTEFHTKGDYAGQEINIGEFFVPEYGIRGRIFPLDEIIKPMTTCDIIIQNFKRENIFPPTNIDAQIYHDLYPGELIKIKVSRITNRGEPSFKIFNHIGGFIKDWGISSLYKKIKIGSKVRVEIRELREKHGKYIVLTRPLETLE